MFINVSEVQGKAVKQEDFDTARLSPDGLRGVRNMTLGVKTAVIFSPHDGLNQCVFAVKALKKMLMVNE